MLLYRRPTQIQAMTFDLDDTLYDNGPVIRRVETQLNKWMAQHHPLYTFQPSSWWLELKKELVASDPALKHDVSLWRQRHLSQGLMRLGYSAEQASHAADDAMLQVMRWRSDFTVPSISHHTLQELSKRFPLVAITNGNVDADKIGIGHYFQSVYKSGIDGRAKPWGDLFGKAQRDLSVPRHRILHIGDDLNSDVNGAKRAGYQACWLNNGRSSLFGERKARSLPDIEIRTIDELLLLL
ncbi:5-amino-6-(5-phospho-D-ribitylamino)uracil phosphatase YigB [Vibrio sp. S4M6]|uniref:5-amino-6-(5-phospho-D-ribitylamino)uracil phosphatase YigB n=1 Tax=Vibrio sinus TaxID=2946865 RepID=UPI002029B853|nr:5-amino-6-(5-phospho-D-ribitylamino)uracil phosphatase YigB [Vibrio sinus]MCL9783552.1 5-amino-6-(5-phospho-D-ribitylamino)uracil phosphatase YigB [Vibrio sinus]